MNCTRLSGVALAAAMAIGQAALSAPVVSVPDDGDMLWSVMTMLMGATDGTVGFGARIENDTADPMSLRLEFSTNGWASAETAVFAMNDAVVLTGSGVVTDPHTGTVSNVTCDPAGLSAGKNVVGVLWDAKRQLGPVDIEGVQLRWVAWTEAGETSVSDPVRLDLHFAETAAFSLSGLRWTGFRPATGELSFAAVMDGTAPETIAVVYCTELGGDSQTAERCPLTIHPDGASGTITLPVSLFQNTSLFATGLVTD